MREDRILLLFLAVVKTASLEILVVVFFWLFVKLGGNHSHKVVCDFLLNKKRPARDVHPSEKKKVTKVTCAWCVKFRKGHSLLH